MNPPGLPEALPCPGFLGGEKLDAAAMIVQGDGMARRGYPPEFRRRVVELVEGGRKVAEIYASWPSATHSPVFTWREVPT